VKRPGTSNKRFRFVGPGRLRSAALDQIGLAETRLIQGELEEATRLGHEAVTVVEQTPLPFRLNSTGPRRVGELVELQR